MVNLIDKHREALIDLCQKYHVKRLDVFGSAARGDFVKSSDIDFLVEFDNEVTLRRADSTIILTCIVLWNSYLLVRSTLLSLAGFVIHISSDRSTKPGGKSMPYHKPEKYLYDMLSSSVSLSPI